MKKNEIIALYDRDPRIEVRFPHVRREVFPNLVRHVPENKTEPGFVIYSRLSEDETEAVVRAQIEYYSGLGLTFEWKVFGHDTPANLKDRLAEHGFDVGEEESILILDLKQAASSLRAPVQHTIRRVTDPAEIDVIIDLENRVWNSDHSDLGQFLKRSLREDSAFIRIYLAYIDDRPASAAWMYMTEGSQFASLWGGSTLPEYRKQGLYSALLATRLQEAEQHGVQFLTVDASPMSRPILEKLGFVCIDFSYPCTYPADTP